MLWLGIDVGTTGTRALLVDEHGTVRAAHTAAHEPIRIEQPQWAEQSPDNWWEAAQRAIPAVLAEARCAPGDVAAVGVTGQMHGLVLLDAQDRVLGPSLIWCDQRSQAQVEWIQARVGRENVLRHTCNPPLTGFTAPKLLWVREHRPEYYERARKLQLPKDYVRFQLTGEYAIDVADASGTGLFDVAQRRWSKAMIEALDIPAELLPPAFESVEVAGGITATAAKLTGLRKGTPVVVGAGDQAAGGVGNGIVHAGLASSTIGTSGVVFAATDQPVLDGRGRIHTFCHAVSGKWHVMGVTQAAGLSLRWYRDQFARPDQPGQDAYDLLAATAATAPPGCEGLLFLPYLMGERSPHLDPDVRGGWIGLTAAHEPRHFIRAILEGVAFSLRDTLEIIRELKLPVTEVRLAGGGAASALWREIQAAVFNRPTAVLASTEGASFGAALLAMVGSGHYATLEEACAETITPAERREPSKALAAIYENLYTSYVHAYPAVAVLTHELTAFDRQQRPPVRAQVAG